MTTSQPPAEGKQAEMQEAGEQAPSKGMLKSGVDPREAAALSHAARREKKEAAETAAALDALTLSARVGTAAARTLGTDALAEVLGRLHALSQGKHGATPGVQIQAAQALGRWLALCLALPEGEDNALGTDPARMTAQQRAAERALVQGMLAQRQKDITEGEHTETDASAQQETDPRD